MAVVRSIQLKESIFRHLIPELRDNPEWHEFIEALLNSASITSLLDMIHELPEHSEDGFTPFEPILRYVPSFTASQVPLPFKGGSRYNLLMAHSVQDLKLPTQTILELNSVIKPEDYTSASAGSLFRINTHYNLDVFNIDVLAGSVNQVTLETLGSHKVDTVRVIREVADLPLPEAKALVENTPSVIPVNFATEAEALELSQKLNDLGNTTSINSVIGTSLEVVSHVNDAIFVKNDPAGSALLLVIQVPIKPDASKVLVADNPLTLKALAESIPAILRVADDPAPVPPGPGPAPEMNFGVHFESLGGNKLQTINTVYNYCQGQMTKPEIKDLIDNISVSGPFNFPAHLTESDARACADDLNNLGNVADVFSWV